MKKNLFLSLILSVALFSCSKDNGNNGSDGENGTIVIKSNVNPEVAPIFSKAGTPVDADYWVKVEGPSASTRQISDGTTFSVTAGNYTVTVANELTYTLPAFNTPIYQASDTKLVTKGSTTTFNLECKQINAGVKFVFDQSIKAYYPNLKTTVAHHDDAAASLEFVYADEDNKTAYFEAGKTVRISLMNDLNDVKIGGEAYKDITVDTQELWTITLKTTQTGSGAIEVVATVDKTVIDKGAEFELTD